MNKRGFSLIELLLVVGIIGILSSIIVVSLGSARTSGKDAKRISDIKNIQAALAQYYSDKGSYPSVIAGASGLTGLGYLSSEPKDPGTGASYKYAALTTQTACNTSTRYHLAAILDGPENLGPLADDADSIMSPVYGANTFVACTGDVNFYGNNADCNTDSNDGHDKCYDVMNN